MDIDDETLMALADGEITGDAAARLHARIAADPDLAARYAAFTQSAHWVKEAALADPEARVSSDLEARVRQMAGTDAPEAESKSDKVVPLRRRMPQWQPMALAASLALAVGLFDGARSRTRCAGAGRADPDRRVARSSGHAALGGASRPRRRAAGDVVASFTDGAGAFCREYETQGPGAAGYVSVACREGDAWDLRFAMATSGGTGGYAPAASLEALDAFYAATGASQPLDPEEEQRFLE